MASKFLVRMNSRPVFNSFEMSASCKIDIMQYKMCLVWSHDQTSFVVQCKSSSLWVFMHLHDTRIPLSRWMQKHFLRLRDSGKENSVKPTRQKNRTFGLNSCPSDFKLFSLWFSGNGELSYTHTPSPSETAIFSPHQLPSELDLKASKEIVTPQSLRKRNQSFHDDVLSSVEDSEESSQGE